MRFRLLAGGGLLLAVLAGSFIPATAAAEEPDASIDSLSTSEKKTFLRLTEKAEETYNDGEFERTIPILKEAYEILPRAEILYRLALSHERAGHPRKALRYYRAYLERKPNTDKKGTIEATVSSLEDKIEDSETATVTIESTPSGADVYVKSQGAETREAAPRGTTPVELRLSPGKIEVSLEKSKYESLNRTIQVEGGETYTFSYSLDKTSDAKDPKAEKEDSEGEDDGSETEEATAESDDDGTEASEDDEQMAETDTGSSESDSPASTGTERMSLTPPLVATVVGGAGAVVGGVFYGIGRGCMVNKQTCTASELQTQSIVSYAGGGVGVLGLGAAGVLWAMRAGLFADNGAGESDSPTVRFVVTPTGLQLLGTFH